jgi:hypothetical protein
MAQFLVISLAGFPLPIPLANSLFLLNPSYLLGIPPLVWCDPVHPGPRLLVNWPPPPHSNFPTPRGFPKSIVRLTKTTSRSRLDIVRNRNFLKIINLWTEKNKVFTEQSLNFCSKLSLNRKARQMATRCQLKYKSKTSKEWLEVFVSMKVFWQAEGTAPNELVIFFNCWGRVVPSQILMTMVRTWSTV